MRGCYVGGVVSHDQVRSDIPQTRAERRLREREGTVLARGNIVSGGSIVLRRGNIVAGPGGAVLRRGSAATGCGDAVPGRADTVLRRGGAAAGRENTVSAQRSGRSVKATPAATSRAGALRRGRSIRAVTAFLIVPGLVGVFALPAYAVGAGVGANAASSSHFNRTVAEAQEVIVSGQVADPAISRDSYTAITKADADHAARVAETARLAAARAERVKQVRATTVHVPGDDYPWWDQLPDTYGGGLSPLNYFYRECVDFAAWRLNRDVGSTSPPFRFVWANLASGSAYMWLSAWRHHGWPVSSTPIVGSVAWFPYNHVAYVQAINSDGSVNIEEYNWGSNHTYGRRTIAASDATYLYPPPG
ncbi:MAG: hypothetical protein B5766_11695 [Candidatus Lumbricidophila eiseniae]|uniref:Peptidase C51 domain-containing protein n=1 Tax=Candidatus Lumbricidiphila eiseniae TaxID=1969409 RepID=A0A2A6FPH6_9MICO|nr:MAG: hypothetical protein B5766_11695 [Candidatus Lumbricidophila eiseniae]